MVALIQKRAIPTKLMLVSASSKFSCVLHFFYWWCDSKYHNAFCAQSQILILNFYLLTLNRMKRNACSRTPILEPPWPTTRKSGKRVSLIFRLLLEQLGQSLWLLMPPTIVFRSANAKNTSIIHRKQLSTCSKILLSYACNLSYINCIHSLLYKIMWFMFVAVRSWCLLWT